jgi:hypothetical protein
MKRIGVVLSILVSVYLTSVWLARRNAAERLERRTHSRAGTVGESSSRVRITQFYASPGEITDADHSTVCYGVENARSVRIEPAVANVRPALTRCFWVEPKQDTAYALTAEGADGTLESASFTLRVKPAPPEIVYMAVSKKEIVKGDAVTVCYGVDHASRVWLDPIGWSFPGKKNCLRLYPPGNMTFTLVAAGESGLTARDHFSVKVATPPR